MTRKILATLALLGSSASTTLAGELAVDSAASKLEFVGSKTDGKHAGGFKDFKGAIATDGKGVEKVTLEIKTSSIYSDDAKLTAHLKSGDFFNVNKYPKATFSSTKIEPISGEKDATHKVTGELTLLGVTKEVTFPAKVAVSGKSAKLAGKVTINKKDFGMTYGEGKILPEVPVTFALETSK